MDVKILDEILYRLLRDDVPNTPAVKSRGMHDYRNGLIDG